MKKFMIAAALLVASAIPALAADTAAKPAASPAWAMNATVIEACSCPMFCQCYFSTAPAAHEGHEGHEEHYCRANNVFKVNKG